MKLDMSNIDDDQIENMIAEYRVMLEALQRIVQVDKQGAQETAQGAIAAAALRNIGER